MCEFTIDGNPALSLRAIPYVTVWEIGPTDIACAVMEPPEWEGRKYETVLQAHYLDSGDIPRALLPKESEAWALEVLDERVQRGPREEQLRLIPAGLFVWKNDFMAWLAAINEIRTSRPPYGPGLPPVQTNFYPVLSAVAHRLIFEQEGDVKADIDLAAAAKHVWLSSIEQASRRR